MFIVITLHLMQQLQSPPLSIKGEQFEFSLEKGEEKAKITHSNPIITNNLPASNLVQVDLISTLEGSRSTFPSTRISSLTPLTDTPEKTKKAWLQQAFVYFRSRLSLVKTRVSVLDRQV